MRLTSRIAMRFLLSSKGQTTLIIFGIAIGISVQVFIGLLIQGLQNDLINTTVGSTSHITVKQEEYFDTNPSIIATLEANENITKVSKVLQINGLLKTKDDSTVIIVNGSEYGENQDIGNLNKKLVAGRLPLNNNEVIVSNFYENINIDDEIEIITVNSMSKLKVVGVFDFGNTTINEKFVYTNIETLQKDFKLENKISYVETQILDVFKSETVANTISNEISNQYNVVSWQQENGDLLQALSSQSLSSYIIQVCVVIAVALAIASVLIVSVVQKSKQIGILKAMGLTNSGISQVFLFQGLILGIAGSLIGVVLGISLLEMFTTFAIDDSGAPVININYNIQFIFLSFCIGTLSALISSLIPARKSKKLSAMEVISNG